jgi:transmembrane sensor
VKIKKDIIFYQLLADKDFKDWVMSPDSNRNYFWENWINQHPNDLKQILMAKEFIRRASFKEMQMSPLEQDEILKKIISIEQRPGNSKVNKETWLKSLDRWAKIAAVFSLLLVSALLISYWNFGSEKVEFIGTTPWEIKNNKRGERSEFLLPDGSHVHLNYESQIRFPLEFDENYRVVELRGEAFFQVVKNSDKPFIVKVNNLETEVLGTSFNIKSLENSPTTEISLVTGKVKVYVQENPSKIIYLSPGDQLRYDDRTKELISGEFNLDKVTSWKEGTLIFENSSLAEFIDKLERWYGVEVQLDGKSNEEWKINGRYQNEKLDDILKGLSFVYGIKYTINGKNVTLNLI